MKLHALNMMKTTEFCKKKYQRTFFFKFLALRAHFLGEEEILKSKSGGGKKIDKTELYLPVLLLGTSGAVDYQGQLASSSSICSFTVTFSLHNRWCPLLSPNIQLSFGPQKIRLNELILNGSSRFQNVERILDYY